MITTTKGDAMRPIIFLDIDGVLNAHEKLPGSAYCGIEPRCMALLNDLLAKTRAEIVITSAWRYLILNGSMTLAGFQNMMATHGLVPHEAMIGFVGKDSYEYESRDHLYALADRDGAIHEWREINKRWGVHVVIDDLPLPVRDAVLVQTDGAVGLTQADCDRAAAILLAE
jgi:hypothetical protein